MQRVAVNDAGEMYDVITTLAENKKARDRTFITMIFITGSTAVVNFSSREYAATFFSALKHQSNLGFTVEIRNDRSFELKANEETNAEVCLMEIARLLKIFGFLKEGDEIALNESTVRVCSSDKEYWLYNVFLRVEKDQLVRIDNQTFLMEAYSDVKKEHAVARLYDLAFFAVKTEVAVEDIKAEKLPAELYQLLTK